MAEVKWIKITTDMFDNRKVRHLRRLPDGNNIVLIWVMLLTMAGRCNSNGMIFLTENIPYTPKMLADELDFEENTVQLALNALSQLNMVVTDGNYFAIAGWEEYQNIEGMEKIREQNRLAQQRLRAKRKQLQAEQNDVSCDSNMTVTQCHATEEEKEQEQDIEKDNKNISCQQVVDEYHAICTSFPKIRRLTPARSNAIKARLKSYSLDDFRTVFKNAEDSSFLKGDDGGWKASFDWLIKEANMVKVLEGNYADKPKRYKRDERVIYGASGQLGEAELEAINKLMANDTADFLGLPKDKPVEADPERAEQLKQRLREKYGKGKAVQT